MNNRHPIEHDKALGRLAADAGIIEAPREWYCKPTAGHETHGQSAVADANTGRTIAVVYDGDAHGELIAAAPDLAEMLAWLYERSTQFPDFYNGTTGYAQAARAALQKAGLKC